MAYLTYMDRFIAAYLHALGSDSTALEKDHVPFCSPLIICNIPYYVTLNVFQNRIKNLEIMNRRLNNFWNCVYLFCEGLI